MSFPEKHPVVCFGETLWDMLPQGKQAGGAPMNVAYHLQKLGKNPAVISKIGYDEPGKQLIETLERKGICTDYFQMDSLKPTSLVKAEIREQHEVVYTILEDVAWDYIDYTEELGSLVSRAEYFVFGSLATRRQRTFETLQQLLPQAKQKVLDINLRPPFYNRQTIEFLISHADVVKMNEAELELITGWFSPLSDIPGRMKVLIERFHLSTLVVTRGGKGAILYTGEKWFGCEGIPVQINDTVGSGDSFLAGLLSKILDGAGGEEALQFANTLAAFITTQKGACPDYHLGEIRRVNDRTPVACGAS